MAGGPVLAPPDPLDPLDEQAAITAKVATIAIPLLTHVARMSHPFLERRAAP
jgi:hypothetical protein